MKGMFRTVYFYYAAGFVVAVIAVAYVLGRNTRIAKTNREKRMVREHFMAGQYSKAFWGSKHLVDSLRIREDAVKMNLSNAGFLSTRKKFADNTFLEFLQTDSTRGAVDTTKLSGLKLQAMILHNGVESYKALADSASDNRIASDALNQLGIITCRITVAKTIEDAEKGMNEAADYFKRALKKDPENDFARFNYELITMKIRYPDLVAKQVNDLINQRKYKEARDLIRKAMRTDERMQQKYPDMVQRIQTIISIDSLSRS